MSNVDLESLEERNSLDDVRRLAKELAAASCAIWNWGDGFGGIVREIIEDAFDARGLVRPAEGSSSDGRDSISANVRGTVFARDGMRCRECGAAENLTIDHVIPVVRGGGDEIGNLQTLCRTCNSKKGVR